jgi:hypothetical protein
MDQARILTFIDIEKENSVAREFNIEGFKGKGML